MSGIYVASKTKHAHIWKSFRKKGFPIISTWIDEAGPGETNDLSDLWIRCIQEASKCDILIAYIEDGDELKGALVEIGAALGNRVPVFAVGKFPGSFINHPLVSCFDSLDDAFALLPKQL